MIIDVHTHDPCRTNAIISVGAHDVKPEPGKYYSVGIHPWNTVEEVSEDVFASVIECAANDRVVAIGETGIDKLRGGSLAYQMRIFRLHIALSEELRKPLIIHNVRATNEILRLRKDTKARQPWIFHGFRGNANIVNALMKEDNLYFSFGENFNPSAMCLVPLERLLIETDESELSICDIAKKIASIREMKLQSLMENIEKNVEKLFNERSIN